MEKNYQKLFSYLYTEEPSLGLFDRIIFAIKREKELRQTRRLLFIFPFLFMASFVSIPFSWRILENQVASSGIHYFISAAFSDFGTFFILWKDFSLAILESLPLSGIIVFALSIGLSIFTLRLFLYKKKSVISYLTHNFA